MINLIDLYAGSRVRAHALEWLYELMKEREPEINISHRELPTMEQHRQFWTRRVYRFCYLIEFTADTPHEAITEGAGHIAPVWCGYVSATHNNEIGIVLRKPFRGQGIGPRAVKLMMSIHQPNPAEPSVRSGRWLANIAPRNERSHSMFKAMGFYPISTTYEYNGNPDPETLNQE